jgi:hypothetical protein
MEADMQPVDRIGTFTTRKFSRFRNPTIDMLAWGSQRHHIPILLEIDVTAARATIHAEIHAAQKSPVPLGEIQVASPRLDDPSLYADAAVFTQPILLAARVA